MSNLIGWLMAGAIFGWLASRITRNYALQGLVQNILAGAVGAFLAGRVLAPLIGIGAINQKDFSLPAFLASLVGAIALLAVVSLFRRGSRAR